MVRHRLVVGLVVALLVSGLVACQPTPTGNHFYLHSWLYPSGTLDVDFRFGNPGDWPIAGDWDGDGNESIGVFRDGTFYLLNTNGDGEADRTFGFGNRGDIPIAGDWDGDGKDTVGVFRDGVFYLRNSSTTGVADVVIPFGNPGDFPLAVNWGSDYTHWFDSVAVWRDGELFARRSLTPGPADSSMSFKNVSPKSQSGGPSFDGVQPGDVPVMLHHRHFLDTVLIARDGWFYLVTPPYPTQGGGSTSWIVWASQFGNPGDFPIAGEWKSDVANMSVGVVRAD